MILNTIYTYICISLIIGFMSIFIAPYSWEYFNATKKKIRFIALMTIFWPLLVLDFILKLVLFLLSKLLKIIFKDTFYG